MTKKAPKKKLNWRRTIGFLLSLLIIGSGCYYVFTMPVKNIKIEGTNLLTDQTIINTAGLTYYPPIFRLNPLKIKKQLKKLDLVAEVEIKRNLKGQITIRIKENRPLFYHQSRDLVVLTGGKEVANQSLFLGLPILINYVPNDIYQKLITGFSELNSDIISLISEIEYAPSQNTQGKILDDSRFALTMNDGNLVYINPINILRLNKYLEIFANLGDKKGIIQLDSSNSNVVSFVPFTESEPVIDEE